jgi:hypothetical protein
MGPKRIKPHTKIVDVRREPDKILPVSWISLAESTAHELAYRFGMSYEHVISISNAIKDGMAHVYPSLNGISRIDAGKQHTWFARIHRGAVSGSHTAAKSFADSRCGGREKALQAARQWRDDTLATIVIATPKEHACVKTTNRQRRETMEKQLQVHGKCYMRTGTGLLASKRAAIEFGQHGKTCAAIRDGAQDGFYLGGNRPRYAVAGFMNEITPRIEKQIRREIRRRARHWMSSEDIELAASNAMMSWASIDLSSVSEDYIERLAGSVVRTADRRRSAERKKQGVSLDLNGEIETLERQRERW